MNSYWLNSGSLASVLSLSLKRPSTSDIKLIGTLWHSSFPSIWWLRIYAASFSILISLCFWILNIFSCVWVSCLSRSWSKLTGCRVSKLSWLTCHMTWSTKFAGSFGLVIKANSKLSWLGASAASSFSIYPDSPFPLIFYTFSTFIKFEQQ